MPTVCLIPPAFPYVGLLTLPVNEWRGRVINDFELNIFRKYPLIGELKMSLYEAGALYASLSGKRLSRFTVSSGKSRYCRLHSRNTFWQQRWSELLILSAYFNKQDSLGYPVAGFYFTERTFPETWLLSLFFIFIASMTIS